MKSFQSTAAPHFASDQCRRKWPDTFPRWRIGSRKRSFFFPISMLWMSVALGACSIVYCKTPYWAGAKLGGRQRVEGIGYGFCEGGSYDWLGSHCLFLVLASYLGAQHASYVKLVPPLNHNSWHSPISAQFSHAWRYFRDGYRRS